MFRLVEIQHWRWFERVLENQVFYYLFLWNIFWMTNFMIRKPYSIFSQFLKKMVVLLLQRQSWKREKNNCFKTNGTYWFDLQKLLLPLRLVTKLFDQKTKPNPRTGNSISSPFEKGVCWAGWVGDWWMQRWSGNQLWRDSTTDSFLQSRRDPTGWVLFLIPEQKILSREASFGMRLLFWERLDCFLYFF